MIIFILQSVRNTLADSFPFQWANKIFGCSKTADQISSIYKSYQAPIAENILKDVDRWKSLNSWLMSFSFVKTSVSQAQLFL